MHIAATKRAPFEIMAARDMTERPQSPGEKIANSVVHKVALLAAIAGVPFLLAPACPRKAVAGSAVSSLVQSCIA